MKNSDSSANGQQLLELQKQFYQELKAKGRSINTLKNYKTDLDCFNHYLIEQSSSIEVTKMQTAHIIQYGQYLEGRYNSDNSRRRRVQALRLFFDFLVVRELVSSNPVRQVPTSPKFLDRPRPVSLTHLKTLWQYLLQEAKSDNSMHALLARRNQVIVLLIYSGALKVSDLAQLRRDSISIAKNEDEHDRVLIKPDKRDPYTVPLCAAFGPVYQEFISALKRIQDEQNISFDELLFNANPYRIISGGLSARGLEVIFGEWRNLLMIDITPKSLRQAAILRWLQINHKDALIKEWMGVAPSYSLKLYKEYIHEQVYDDTFLMELYYHYKNKNFP